MKRLFFIFLLMYFVPLLASSFELDTYSTENRIFYIERSKNKNIVCYDFNVTESGELNTKEPISIYWVNREEHPGKRGKLSFIQRKMAYGYSVIKNEEKTITVKLNALKAKLLTLGKDSSFFCRTDINNQLATVTKVYVKTKDSNSMSVEYVDIFGYSIASNQFITERIFP